MPRCNTRKSGTKVGLWLSLDGDFSVDVDAGKPEKELDVRHGRQALAVSLVLRNNGPSGITWGGFSLGVSCAEGVSCVEGVAFTAGAPADPKSCVTGHHALNPADPFDRDSWSFICNYADLAPGTTASDVLFAGITPRFPDGEAWEVHVYINWSAPVGGYGPTDLDTANNSAGTHVVICGDEAPSQTCSRADPRRLPETSRSRRQGVSGPTPVRFREP